ncbi:MAG: hypothetical protein JSV93_04040 [Candidatus Omnitrophota bacterium]|nr:MAG: hypothetical protein JSV93_04040 [Candidatus Omnitrophota bacterium]
MKIKYLAILLMFPVLLSSCAFHQRYPSDWAQPITNEKVDITGGYNNTDKDGFFLSAFIFNDIEWERQKSITHVEIKQFGNQEIEFVAWNEDTIIDKKLFPLTKGDYRLISGGIKKRNNRFVSEQGVIGMERGYIIFTKSADGYLILKSRSKVMGMCFFIPVAGSEKKWYRFHPWEK